MKIQQKKRAPKGEAPAQDVDQPDREEERNVLEVVPLDAERMGDLGRLLLVRYGTPGPKTVASSWLMKP